LTALIDRQHKEVSLMKSVFPVLVAAALLFGASAAQAARPMGHGAAMSNSNIFITPPAPVQSTAPPTVNSGALDVPQSIGTPPVNAGAIGSINPSAMGAQPSFGAQPGSPGSATYDPNAALPSLDDQGSALSPTPSTSASGFNTPSTNSGG
jgi:hypothetical protein